MLRPVRGVVLCLWLMCFTSPARAQHHEHMHAPPPARREAAAYPLFQTDMRRMTGMVPVDPMGPMPGWQFMTGGVVRFGYNRQGGERGDEGFESTNWVMGMAHHDLGPGRVTFMLMNSLEPATLDDPGSPQLFQTGETFDGEPIVDYQHAHDFFMNLSATYRVGISPRSGVWAQFAPVGEPALGPVAFMHRPSSGDNPSAPLGHHWQDATHITYNVATVGAGWDRVALDVSAFHGGEPDEDRWDIDGGDIDSYSGRLSVNLSHDWSVMASYGDLNDPHAEMPGDETRTNVSLEYGAAGDGASALLLLWGRNDEDHGVSDSFLAEYAHQFERHQLFGRVEWVEKDEQLLLTREHTHNQGGDMPLADVTAFTVGYFHTGRIFAGLGIGGDATFYVVPSSLQSEYGDFPVSIHAFIRARWLSAAGGHHH